MSKYRTGVVLLFLLISLTSIYSDKTAEPFSKELIEKNKICKSEEFEFYSKFFYLTFGRDFIIPFLDQCIAFRGNHPNKQFYSENSMISKMVTDLKRISMEEMYVSDTLPDKAKHSSDYNQLKQRAENQWKIFLTKSLNLSRPDWGVGDNSLFTRLSNDMYLSKKTSKFREFIYSDLYDDDEKIPKWNEWLEKIEDHIEYHNKQHLASVSMRRFQSPNQRKINEINQNCKSNVLQLYLQEKEKNNWLKICNCFQSIHQTEKASLFLGYFDDYILSKYLIPSKVPERQNFQESFFRRYLKTSHFQPRTDALLNLCSKN